MLSWILVDVVVDAFVDAFVDFSAPQVALVEARNKYQTIIMENILVYQKSLAGGTNDFYQDILMENQVAYLKPPRRTIKKRRECSWSRKPKQ